MATRAATAATKGSCHPRYSHSTVPRTNRKRRCDAVPGTQTQCSSFVHATVRAAYLHAQGGVNVRGAQGHLAASPHPGHQDTHTHHLRSGRPQSQYSNP